MVTDTIIMATVTIAGSQRLTNPMATIPRAEPIPTAKEAILQPSKKIKDTTTGQGIQTKKSLNFPRAIFRLSLMASKNHSPFTSIH